MGRAGSGSSGGSGRGGGSRTGGGHHIGGGSSGRPSSPPTRGNSGRPSSPPTRGNSGRPPSPPRGNSGRPPSPPRGNFRRPPSPPRERFRRPFPRPPGRRMPIHRRNNGFGCLAALIVIIVIVIFLFGNAVKLFSSTADSFMTSQQNSQENMAVREKINTGNPFLNDCIIDEIGWFDNITRAETGLKDFWTATGVQPYIILKAYDPELTTDTQKEQWTINYYDANFTAENIFLYVYFAEADTDNDVGYMCYANGEQTSAVMDSEAVDIFWDNIDKYWYTDISTDDLFIKVFSETASSIM